MRCRVYIKAESIQCTSSILRYYNTGQKYDTRQERLLHISVRLAGSDRRQHGDHSVLHEDRGQGLRQEHADKWRPRQVDLNLTEWGLSVSTMSHRQLN